MAIEDFNRDGNLDILLAGNLYASEVETPRSDAGIGLVLAGNGKGAFEPIPYSKSGLLLDKDVQALRMIPIKGELHIMAANNQGALQVFKNN